MKLIISVILLFCFSTTQFYQEPKVIICKSSSSYAYHDHFCQGLKQCRAATEKLTLEEAISLGRKACGYCYKSAVDKPKSNATINTDKPLKSARSSQCAATTKRGTRCSRTTRTGSYCWQHGG